MRWIGSDAFLGTVREVRTLWISGIYGTGKTLTSVAIAGWLLSNGWADSFISNIPVNGQDAPKVPMENCVVLLDEAHLFLPDWESVKAYSAFLRKVNMRILMPSIYPPHGKLRILEMQRVFNGYRILGMLTPFWVYRWRVNAGMFSEKGSAILYAPHDLFGAYDTEAVLDENADENILDCVTKTIAQKSSKSLAEIQPVRVVKNAKTNARPKTSASKAERDSATEAANTFRDAANSITDGAQSIADSAERISRTLRKY